MNNKPIYKPLTATSSKKALSTFLFILICITIIFLGYIMGSNMNPNGTLSLTSSDWDQILLMPLVIMAYVLLFNPIITIILLAITITAIYKSKPQNKQIIFKIYLLLSSVILAIVSFIMVASAAHRTSEG